jgi:FtsP/CotA-like multicopper oxidase with cupredoxin domain
MKFFGELAHFFQKSRATKYPLSHVPLTMNLYAHQPVNGSRTDVGMNFIGFARVRAVVFLLIAVGLWNRCAAAAPAEVCPQPRVGSAANQPAEIVSAGGLLHVELRFRSDVDADGRRRYCYVAADGKIAPTLRVNPGDWLEVSLKNEIPIPPARDHRMMAAGHPEEKHDPCAGGIMIDGETNLHFHGLAVPPVCHQDETIRTMIGPGEPAFLYRIHIPDHTTPGLYWYHPHPHGFAKAQVLGGASGALIVEGIEQVNSLTAGLPERVLVIRDQELLNPDSVPVKTDSIPPPMVFHDAEGDVLNTGTGGGKPAKDLSVNFVAVPFPKYPPALLSMKPGQRELWRVLNASAITYLDLQLLFAGKLQPLGVVALDGSPTNLFTGKPQARWQSHALVPPAGRVEFIVTGPPPGISASLVTRTVDTGPAGENDPTRPLISIETRGDAPALRALPVSTNGPAGVLVASTSPPKLPSRPAWVGEATAVRVRRLFFYEEPEDPKDPNSPTKFYITTEGHSNKQFDPSEPLPNMVVEQGTVEDWIIENRTKELHVFHIHQIHFLLQQWNGVPVDEPFLRDTVNVPYWDGYSPTYPSVKLRMDFRDPAIVGTFAYHCHLLEHQDGGMMGTIRVQNSDTHHRAELSVVK